MLPKLSAARSFEASAALSCSSRARDRSLSTSGGRSGASVPSRCRASEMGVPQNGWLRPSQHQALPGFLMFACCLDASACKIGSPDVSFEARNGQPVSLQEVARYSATMVAWTCLCRHAQDTGRIVPMHPCIASSHGCTLLTHELS